MNALLSLWSREPSRIVSFVEAVLLLLLAFGVEISDAQLGAIIGVVGAIIVLLGGQVTRSVVYSPATVEKLTAPNPVPGTTISPSQP